MITVLTFGTFDKFHPGHQYFLTEAKKHGDYLVVVIARDSNVEKIKHKQPSQSEQQRLAQVRAFAAVDEAVLGQLDFSKRFDMIAQTKPDIICLGYDQRHTETLEQFNIPIIRLPAYHPEKYKSSLIDIVR